MSEFFHLMTYPFLACLLIAGIHVYLGLHVISRKVIFVDLALAQIAAFGAIYGVLLGYDLHEDVWAIKGFSLLFAFLGAVVFSLTRMRREKVPHEAIIGITYAVALAATILGSVHLAHGADEVSALLAGSILWVRGDTILYLALLYAAVGWFHYRHRHRFLTISLDPDSAEASGVNLQWWDFLFYFSFALVITNSVAIGGVLLVFSYLVIPSVVAVLFADGITVRLIIGWVVGTIVSVIGVVLSYTQDLPSGPTIVVCFAGFLLLAALVRYVVTSRYRSRSLVRVAAGVAAAFLLFFLGGSLRKEEKIDLHHLLASRATNEKLMGLKVVEGEASEWSSLVPEIPRLLNDPEPDVRALTLSIIEKYGDSDLSDLVVKTLDDPDDGVRETAIGCLKVIGDDHILEDLIRRGRVEEDPYLKVELADLIVDLGDYRGLGLLVEVMDDAEALQARKEAFDRIIAHTGTGLTFNADVPSDQNDDLVVPFQKLVVDRVSGHRKAMGG